MGTSPCFSGWKSRAARFSGNSGLSRPTLWWRILANHPASMGLVMQWLLTAVHDIQQGFAATRVYHLFNRRLDIETATERAHGVLKVIDPHLAQRQWLDQPTIADIAYFPYITLAEDGKISLADYPNVLDWIARVKQLPGYVAMPGL
jgi:glutathione S-transferase